MPRVISALAVDVPTAAQRVGAGRARPARASTVRDTAFTEVTTIHP